MHRFLRMIWLDPPRLQQLAAKVRAGGGSVVATFYDAADDDRRQVEIRETDIQWAREVEKVVDLAS